MTVGERLRAARKAKGLTQKALGEACGIAEPTIRRYELGKLNPKYETLEKIASALDVSASELMGIGFLPVEFLLEKQKERERLSKELGLDSTSEFENSLRKFIQSDLPNEDLEFLGDLESLSAIRKCFQELGFMEVYTASSESDDETIALINRRTRLVYIVKYDKYLDALEAVLHNTKQELSKLLDGAGEVMEYMEAPNRGYDDMRFILALEAPSPQDGETMPENGESPPEGRTEPKEAPKQGGE